MTVQCIYCSNASLKEAGAMGRLGFARCPSVDLATFVSMDRPRDCTDFKEAPAGTATARDAWLLKQGIKRA
jgi:hypothetical protein